jgi:hypothetical protein
MKSNSYFEEQIWLSEKGQQGEKGEEKPFMGSRSNHERFLFSMNSG